MTYAEEEKRAAARNALDWWLSAFAKEQGRCLETLKRWVQRYYPDEVCKYSNCMVRIRGTGEEWKGNRLTAVPQAPEGTSGVFI